MHISYTEVGFVGAIRVNCFYKDEQRDDNWELRDNSTCVPSFLWKNFFLLKWDKARNILKKNLHNNNVYYSFFESQNCRN